MRIYNMTATFGKLEHETLVLEPGLNVVTAPNEWGKSTWCAFLLAMFYGLETRTKSTKTTLADKERYAPWSGSPMSGRIDLNWNGRDITIERSTKRRVPLGEFKAYETDSGLPVEGLTAANCGQLLLGVEQSVFRRAGFIRQAELPVTQDEALRRRLNALVTTGDDSGEADRLADSLRDLKNRCRYNKNGLLPQAEQERDALRAKIDELNDLEAQTARLKDQLDDIKGWLCQLNNHRNALAYAQAEVVSAKAAQAKKAMEQAQAELMSARSACQDLPGREQAEQGLRELHEFKEKWRAFELELQKMPPAPEPPKQDGPFAGMSPDEAKQAVQADVEQYESLTSGKTAVLLLIMGILGLLAAGLLVFLEVYPFAGIAGAVSAIALVWGVVERVNVRKQCRALEEKYGTRDILRWTDSIQGYEQDMFSYYSEQKKYQQSRDKMDAQRQMLTRRKETLCADQEPDVVLDYWRKVIARWEAYQNASREAQRSRSHFEAISAMVKPVEKPSEPDRLTQSEAETAQLLADCAAEQQRLQNRLGQRQGRMAALGDKAELEQALEEKNSRISKLENTYAALTIAQETLEKARMELQRRFAPRITQSAQALLSDMTAGRYRSVTMDTDFSLQAAADQEDTLHDALWRSDGTLDQLYLALRLAVAQELTPEAPLILDDVLVRFDDERMAAAVDILRNLAREKQIICFSCQTREKNLLD